MGKIIGIDLGTKYSMAAAIINRIPTLIPNSEGEYLFHSMVGVNENQNLLVGKQAKNQELTNGGNTLSSIKRLMGRLHDDPEVKNILRGKSYKTVKDQKGHLNVMMGSGQYTPTEISAMLLARIKKDAESFLGQTITQAVVSVPAYFNRRQRQATRDAGEIAGLEVLRVINESVAPAMPQYFDEKVDKKIASLNLGAGFLSISIIDVGKGVLQVMSTNGDNLLGGDDFDQKISDFLIQEFDHEYQIDLSQDQLALRRILEASEKAKIELSTVMETEINLPYISKNETGFLNLSMAFTRARLEQLTSDLLVRINDHLRQALTDAYLKSEEIDEVILTGGMTRMPAIVELINNEFKYKAIKCISSNEMVAKGAAIQAGIFEGDYRDYLLLEITPLTLSLETQGGVATPVIERNSTYPWKRSQTLSSTKDNQTSAEVHVLEGERPMSNENTTLGCFILDGISPAPRGIMQVEVTFDLDANGVLDVTAADKATGRSKKERITASELTKQDIESAKIKLAELAQ